jgi:hypothetical protein
MTELDRLRDELLSALAEEVLHQMDESHRHLSLNLLLLRFQETLLRSQETLLRSREETET